MRHALQRRARFFISTSRSPLRSQAAWSISVGYALGRRSTVPGFGEGAISDAIRGRSPMAKKRKAVKRKTVRRTVSKKTWSRPAFKFVASYNPIMDQVTDRRIETQSRLEELTKKYQSEGMTLKEARQQARLVCPALAIVARA